ncbi:MAG: DUF4397 domain-containing protein [Chromatiales bacterium]|nr:DUF4397 domain-containing protein [Chromatiales bacterium]
MNPPTTHAPSTLPAPRRNLFTAGLIAAAASLLAACGSDSGTPQTELRVIHASPDAPKVNVLLDGNAVLTEVDYKAGSGFTSLDRGTYDIAVDAITPAGTATVISVNGASLAADTDYTVVAIGKVANGTLAPLVIANPDTAVPSGQARAQVVHGAPDAPAVSVYVTAPGADLATATALGTFSFGEDLGPVEVPAGNYQIRVTLAGNPAAVVYDAGTVALPSGADLLLVAVANTTTGPAPITLLVNDGTTQAELLDVATTADVRAGHLSPDAPAVDVIVNDDLANPLFNAATYPSLTPYASVPPATYNIKVVDDASQSLTVINENLALARGVSYSVLAVDFLADIGPLVLTDDRRSIATEARVRIVHGSPSAGPVDIYVAAPATDISTINPTFANVPFKANTGYVGLAGGTYEVSVTPAGAKTPVAIFATLPIANGDIFTVIARDNPGGGAPLGLLVEDETD